jgi:hypothetical protein
MPSEFKSHIEVPRGSEKGFGVVFCIVFLLIGLYPLVSGENMRLWAVGMALAFLTLAYLKPQALSFPNKLWFKLGVALGAVIAPIIMLLVYLTTVVPIGLIMRLMGKDLLRQKLDGNAKSYWIDRNEPISSMKNQF